MADPNRPVTGYPAPNTSSTSYPYAAPPPNNSNYYYNQQQQQQQQLYYDPDAVRRAVFLRRVLAVMIAVFIIIGTSFFITWLVLRPRLPELRIDSLSVSNLNLSSSTNLLSANFRFGITARNPNSKISLFYDHIEADVFYQRLKLADTALTPFSQSKKNQTSITATAAAMATYVDADLVTAMDAQRTKTGNLNFNLRMLMVLRLKAGGWFARKRYLKAFCGDLSVALSSNSSNGTLLGGPRQCSVGF